MKTTIKIKLHSAVDLITNSSTVIFTYSGGAVPALKDLVDEILKTFGSELKFDDIFYAEVFLEDGDQYMECQDDNEEYILTLPEGYDGDESKYLSEIKRKILIGEIEKPEWMVNCEESESWSGYPQSTSIEILAKDEAYTELANKLLKYLYSTDHEATRD